MGDSQGIKYDAQKPKLGSVRRDEMEVRKIPRLWGVVFKSEAIISSGRMTRDTICLTTQVWEVPSSFVRQLAGFEMSSVINRPSFRAFYPTAANSD